MTIYEFMAKQEECHKLTFPKINAISLVNAFSLLEGVGDRATEVRMNQTLFSQFACNVFNQKSTNSIYERVIRTMTFMNAKIIIDNDIEDHIVVVIGNKDDGMSTVKLFIGS